jgi:hypothetical protein
VLFYKTFLWRNSPTGALVASLLRFRDHTQLDAPYFVGTTPDEGSARRRDLCLIIYDIHKRQAPMPPVGFEPAIPVSERSQTPLLVRADTGRISIHKHTKVISRKLNLYRLHLEIMLSSNIAFTITLYKTMAVV